MTHPERWPRSSDVICPECENRFTPGEWDAVSKIMPNGDWICEDCAENYDPEYLSNCCTASRWHETDICSRCGEHVVFEDQYGNEEEL